MPTGSDIRQRIIVSGLDENCITVRSNLVNGVFVNRPNFIERRLGITWADKVEKVVKKFEEQIEIVERYR